jgi:hypothetical protein
MEGLFVGLEEIKEREGLIVGVAEGCFVAKQKIKLRIKIENK